MSTMKAVVVQNFGDAEVMKVEEIPIPQPGKKEVLVKIHAAGVNPVDTYIRGGNFGDFAKPPFVPGIDGAGVVEAVGQGVTRFQKGDRVYVFSFTQGTYAQYCVTQEQFCCRLPGKISFPQGAALGIPYFTAYRALFQTGKTSSMDSVLIHGASGGVGIAAVQLAKDADMKVYGTAGTEDGLKLVKENGADAVFNHREKDYEKKIMEATGGKGVDIILEMVANVNLVKDLTLVKKKGIIAIIGSQGPVEINPVMLMHNEIRLVGILMLDMNEKDLDEAGKAVVRGLENGSLTPIVDKEYSLDQAPTSHKDQMEGSGAKGKLVILTK